MRIWTFRFQYPREIDALNSIIDSSAENYLGVPGLVRKYYAISPDGSEVRGIYLWEKVEAADRYQTGEWISMVERRWGVASIREDLCINCIVDARVGKLDYFNNK